MTALQESNTAPRPVDEAAEARALLVFNPHSRRAARALPGLTRCLETEGLAVEVIRSDAPGGLGELLAERRGAGDRIILAGGDGTVHHALPDLVHDGRPVAVVPLGTANDFVRSLGLPLAAADACRVAAHGRVRHVDLGTANGVLFCNAAHLGLGVHVTRKLSPHLNRWLGPLEYVRSVADALNDRRPFTVDVYDDAGRRHQFETLHVAIGNGRYYGAGSVVTDDATIDDARLDLYSLEPRPLRSLMRTAPRLRRGQAGRAADRPCRRAQHAHAGPVRRAGRRPAGAGAVVRPVCLHAPLSEPPASSTRRAVIGALWPFFAA